MNKKFLLLNFLHLLMLLGMMFIQSCKKGAQENGIPPQDLHIDSFAPEAAAKDSVVIIHGANFSPIAAENRVTFNGVTASVTKVTASTLTAVVPTGAGSGKITVETSGRVVSSANDF